ncbi:hypothetical protein BS329_18010 [Amycolatopsis coloradensis]|uniref:Novel STAND NTPase 1 domain-containing protein n=1 Tax=Amycolatopsis coloradensis TaxID=76021 RepID=A0A1R0KT57_9PSEU|nr:WD40 repeat domain-containing protein [Amycolatopsis coloradensis]OLZ51136.1 hypothetical protein BS329_18010 [Amycolatopsis coloradensis]
MRAGLLPLLDDDWAVLQVITPGSSGINELEKVFGTEVRGTAQTVLAAVWNGGPAPAPEKVLHAVEAARGPRQRVLLVVDQFEDAAIQHTEQERHLFLALLYALVACDARLCVVVTVRSEWVGLFQQGPGAELFKLPLMVNVLSPQQIREVVDGPAALTDTRFEPGLVEEIVRDTGRGDALPLLSSLLCELYDGLDRYRYIRRNDYLHAGKVGGAITGRAEAAMAAITQDLDTVLTTLLLFVNLDGDEPTRRYVQEDALTVKQQEVVAGFVQVHLLTSDVDQDGSTTYDVAHEALLRQWPPLADYIEANRSTLRRITELLPLAQAWLNSGRSTSYLVPAERLADLDATKVVFPDPLADFMAASREDAAIERRRRASVAGNRALEILDSDPATAISLSLAACTELAPTSTASTALYRSLATCLRHVLTTGDVKCAALAPDGHIATANANTIQIWAEGGALLHVLTEHDADVRQLAFSSDGRLASGDATGRVILWGVDGTMLRQLKGELDTISSLRFGADGQLAAAAEFAACLWDADGNLLRQLAGDGEQLAGGSRTMVAFTPDNFLVTAGPDGVVRVWGRSGPELYSLRSKRLAPVTALAVSRSGHIAAGHQNGTYYVSKGDRPPIMENYRAGISVLDLALSDSGYLAYVESGAVYVFRLDDYRSFQVAGILIEDRKRVSLAYGPGRLLALADCGEVRLYESSDEVAHVWTMNTKDVRIFGFNEGGRLVASGRDTLHVWDVGTRTTEFFSNCGVDEYIAGHIAELAHTNDPAGRMGRFIVNDLGGQVLQYSNGESFCAFVPDESFATTADRDVKISIQDAKGRLLRTLTAPSQKRLELVTFAAHERLAAVDADGAILIWDVAGQLLHTLVGHDAQVQQIAFAPDGRLASGTETGVVRIWGTDGELFHQFKGHKDAVNALAFAGDGRLATASKDCIARVWDRDGTMLYSTTEEKHPAASLAFGPDGRLITSSFDGTVRVYGRDGSLLHVLDIPGAPLAHPFAVTTAGLVIVGGGDDGITRVWDFDGRLLYSLPGNDGRITGLVLASDGTLITCGRDGKIMRWPAPRPLPDLIADAQRCTLPPLTSAVRHRWMLPAVPKTG